MDFMYVLTSKLPALAPITLTISGSQVKYGDVHDQNFSFKESTKQCHMNLLFSNSSCMRTLV